MHHTLVQMNKNVLDASQKAMFGFMRSRLMRGIPSKYKKIVSLIDMHTNKELTNPVFHAHIYIHGHRYACIRHVM